MKKKRAKRIVSMILALLLVIAMASGNGLMQTVSAEEEGAGVPAPQAVDNPVVDLSILTGSMRLKEENGGKFYSTDGGANWTDYTGSVTLKDGSTMSANQTLWVESGTHDVILENATLQGSSAAAGACPFYISAGASVNLTLNGTNTATAIHNDYAGVQVNEGASLTITADSAGSLTAVGGKFGAGIGGGISSQNGTAGVITIAGGTVDAKGGYYGAGIGGGGENSSGTNGGGGGAITITGGTVTAEGGTEYGAGIGGGGGSAAGGTGGDITITGGTVTAKGSVYGAGIGGGGNYNGTNGGEGGTITITGGTVTARGGEWSAGIGGSSGAGGGVIAIGGGKIDATGGNLGAGIGSGYNAAGSEIAISGGTVNSNGGGRVGALGAGIGGGTNSNVVITGGSISTSDIAGSVTNGEGNASLTVITLKNAENVPVTKIEEMETYGLEGVFTSSDGKLYLYLPENTTIMSITAGDVTYVRMDGTDTFLAVVEFTAQGEGTEKSPYLIPDLNTLENLRDYVNAGYSCKNLYFKLENNIGMSETYGQNGRSWTPIGDNNNPFSGIFDGGGYTISDLYIDGASSYQGLFGHVEDAAIKNLTVSGSVTVTGESDYIGGVVGCSKNTSISAVTSRIAIADKVDPLNHVGGIVGSAQNGTTIDQCVNEGDIALSVSSNCVGGIAGYANGGCKITNSVNRGNVHSDMSDALVGGILGYINNGQFSGIENCYNTGQVSCVDSQRYTGAIVGWAKDSSSYQKMINNYYLENSAVSAFGSGGNKGKAESKTAEQFASGEVAYLLQGTQSSPIWGQTLGEDTFPGFTAEEGKKVVKVAFMVEDAEYKAVYVNVGKTLTEADFPEDPSDEKFVRWIYDDSGSPVTEDITIKAEMADVVVAISGMFKLKEEGGQKLYSTDGGATWTAYTGSITLTNGTGKNYRGVSVESGSHNVILDNVTLCKNEGQYDYRLFYIAGGASVDLTLKGENTTSSPDNRGPDAGIFVSENASLTIGGSGSLTAKGGSNFPGIGSRDTSYTGTITINSGRVTANGGSNAPGIGSNRGSNNPRSKVIINGGTVVSTGDSSRNMADIGGRSNELIINGGNVKGSLGVTPKNSSGTELSLVTITLDGVTESIPVTAVEGVTDYGLEDVYTLDGMLYFYLPKDVTVTSVTAGGQTYTGTLDENRTGTFRVSTSKPAAEVYGATLTLDGTIGVNFYVDMSNVPEAECGNYSMHFTVNGKEQTVNYDADSYRNDFGGDIRYYRFTCPVAAKQMTDEIRAQLFYNGTPVTDEYTYSVKKYCDNAMAKYKENDVHNIIPLLKALLNYGGYAQTCFNYNIGNLANAGLYDPAADPVNTFAANLSPYQVQTSGTSPTGITKVEATLILESSTVIRFYITGSTDGLKFSVDGKEVTPIEITEDSNVVNQDADYYIDVPGNDVTGVIGARQLATPHKLSIVNGTGEEYSVSYSALSYAYSMINGERTGENIKNVSKALYLYYDASTKYNNWASN